MTVAETARVSDLIAGYDNTEVLGPVNLSLQPGVTALLGRNGSGKTTLIRTLCGIIPTLSGTCSVLGTTVTDGAPVRSLVGYLGHDSALATTLTVSQNLRFWSQLNHTYPNVTLVPTKRLINQFDLADVLDRKVGTLSRGQRQRVDLARLAMTSPKFIVLDEPLTGLDPVYAAQTRNLLTTWGETGTVLYSTHSVPEALELAQRFLIVNGHDLIELDARHEAVTEAEILNVLEVDS